MKKCILYGAASIGDLAKNALEKCGFRILGYIDRRAFELESYNGLPVWEIQAIPHSLIDDNTIIYVAVKNVFEHEKIANQLRKYNFKNIIYKPYNSLLGLGNDSEQKLSFLYDKLFSGVYTNDLDFEQLKISHAEALHDWGKIYEKNGITLAYIPVDYIFTNNYLNNPMEKWGNICIAAFFTHIDFFRFLAHYMDAEPMAYLNEYCIFTAQLQNKIHITEAWKHNVIENRSQIYEQMRLALDIDPDFFIRNAALAEWNSEKKYFNLLSGKHRCTFLSAMGKRYIPLKIKSEHYNQYINKEEIEPVYDLLDEHEIVIPHPFFYRNIYSRDRGEWGLFSWFSRFFGRKLFYEYGKIEFSKLTIIDYSADYGNFYRFLTRLGCNVTRKVKITPLEMQLNKLLYMEESNDNYCFSGDAERVNTLIVLENEMEYPEKMLSQYIILRYCKETYVNQFLAQNSYSIKTQICENYQNGERWTSYLLEKNA